MAEKTCTCGESAIDGRDWCRKCFNRRRRDQYASGQPMGPRDPDPETFTDEMIAFGTPIERMSADALIRAGSVAAAALELQLEPRQLRAHLSELQRRAASRGFSPGHDMTNTAPEGFGVKGVSTLYDGDGNVKAQWVKTKADEDHKYSALLDAMSRIADSWQGLAEAVPAPTHSDNDLLACYPVGDAHIGLLTWQPETGHNFDVQIAERNLCKANDQLVMLAPPAREALIVNVGDWYHADNRANTTTNGTPVDSDGRWQKVIAAGIRIMRRMITRALEKHAHVTVINSLGNHDWHGSVMLSIALAQFYENEPRVTIDTSPAKFHYYVFGANLIGVTHGDTVKLAELGQIMACDRAEDWGVTKHRWFLTGHVHHQNVKELHGCIVESFNTLAPGDAWHRGQGYRSSQNSKLLVFHKQWGQINRHIVGIDQIVEGA